MNAEIRPLAEVSQKAREILIREMGIVDTLRFLSQFRYGSGNYTKERGQWLDDLSLDEIVSKIEVQKGKKRRTNG